LHEAVLEVLAVPLHALPRLKRDLHTDVKQSTTELGSINLPFLTRVPQAIRIGSESKLARI
jgi:hypothetical protein